MTTTKKVLNLALDEALLARVDDFWHEQRFNARSEAIRFLIEAGLDRKGATTSKKADRKKAAIHVPLQTR
jgi:metal-responsive CopG/Arc/MetJ family transcriptional regulator